MHKNQYQRVRDRLKAWRLDAGLTQRQLADSLGAHQSYVAKSELGERRLDAAEFKAWAQACGVDPADAIGQI